MARILAIEPDRGRGAMLQRLVGERLGADVILTVSANDALATLADVPPDVILTSSLLSAHEDEQLTAHLRAAPDLDHLPVLQIPPMIEIKKQPVPEGLWARLRARLRRQREQMPLYDFGAITERIEEALEQSKYEAPESEIERPARLILLESGGPLLLGSGMPRERTPENIVSLVRLDSEEAWSEDVRKWRSRARRWHSHQLPWLSGVRLSWGAPALASLRLLNMSSTGLLLESDAHLTVGKKAGFQLAGSDDESLIVEASVVRADLLNEDPTFVTRIVAATFDQPFHSLGRVRSLRDLRRVYRVV